MTNSLQLSLHFNTCSMEEKAGLQRNSVLQFRTTFRRIFGLNCVFYRISIKIAGLVLRLGTLWIRPPNLLFSGPKTGHRPGPKSSAEDRKKLSRAKLASELMAPLALLTLISGPAYNKFFARQITGQNIKCLWFICKFFGRWNKLRRRWQKYLKISRLVRNVAGLKRKRGDWNRAVNQLVSYFPAQSCVCGSRSIDHRCRWSWSLAGPAGDRAARKFPFFPFP